MLVDVLRTHSKVLLDGTVLDNPHCLAPIDYPHPAPDAVTRYPLARLRSGRSDGGISGCPSQAPKSGSQSSWRAG